jgi:hypothetical protein
MACAGYSRRSVVRMIASSGVLCFLPSALVGGRAVAHGLVPQGEEYFRHTVDGETSVIEALDLRLEQSRMPPSKIVIVRADTLRFGSSIVLPGQAVTFIARRIVCAQEAKLDTRGQLGSYQNGRALDGTSWGSRGSDGVDAGSGEHGGSVTIIASEFIGSIRIDASGGAGGDAQSGGNGAEGQPGENWRRDLPGAGNGGSGGTPGRAGSPGRGGNGGDIKVLIQQQEPPPRITTTSERGAPGTPGTHGKPGHGGAPGNGGSYQDCPCAQ